MKKLWELVSNYGVDKSLTLASTRKVIITNQLAYISFLIVLGLNVSFLFNPEFGFDPAGFFSSFLILTTPLLNKLNYQKAAAFIFATLMPLSLTFFSSINKTFAPTPLPFVSYLLPKFFLLSLLILPLVVIDSRHKLLLTIAIGINLSCIFLADYLNMLFGVSIDFAELSFESYSNLNYLLILPMAILILGFLFLNNITTKSEDQILKQNKNLAIANAKIEQINKNITDSIEYAKYIQNALLPEITTLHCCFNDVFVYNKARDIVSGDFYFYRQCVIHEKPAVVIAVADCTGHGVPGGFMSVLGISLLNDIISSSTYTSSADILNELRERVKSALNQTGRPMEQRDGLEMAVVIYDIESKVIEFSGAHNPMVIINKEKEISTLKADKMPISFHVNEKPFASQKITLHGGEMCYLFTDGIIDQMNKNGNRVMNRNFKKWLEQGFECSGQEQLKHFEQKMQKWMTIKDMKLTEQLDDMLLLGFRIK